MCLWCHFYLLFLVFIFCSFSLHLCRCPFSSNTICTKHMTAPILCQFKMAHKETNQNPFWSVLLRITIPITYLTAMEEAHSSSRSKKTKRRHSDIVKSLNRPKAFMYFALFDFFFFAHPSLAAAAACLRCMVHVCWRQFQFRSALQCEYIVLTASAVGVMLFPNIIFKRKGI